MKKVSEASYLDGALTYIDNLDSPDQVKLAAYSLLVKEAGVVGDLVNKIKNSGQYTWLGDKASGATTSLLNKLDSTRAGSWLAEKAKGTSARPSNFYVDKVKSVSDRGLDLLLGGNRRFGITRGTATSTRGNPLSNITRKDHQDMVLEALRKRQVRAAQGIGTAGLGVTGLGALALSGEDEVEDLPIIEESPFSLDLTDAQKAALALGGVGALAGTAGLVLGNRDNTPKTNKTKTKKRSR